VIRTNIKNSYVILNVFVLLACCYYLPTPTKMEKDPSPLPASDMANPYILENPANFQDAARSWLPTRHHFSGAKKTPENIFIRP